jgi:hypothetical protein
MPPSMTHALLFLAVALGYKLNKIPFLLLAQRATVRPARHRAFLKLAFEPGARTKIGWALMG